MLDRLRRLLRRRRMVQVDRGEWQRLAELAVYGAAIEVIENEQERWLLLDQEEQT
jgi:hypothetical protein